jgi:hypothetical protein
MAHHHDLRSGSSSLAPADSLQLPPAPSNSLQLPLQRRSNGSPTAGGGALDGLLLVHDPGHDGLPRPVLVRRPSHGSLTALSPGSLTALSRLSLPALSRLSHGSPTALQRLSRRPLAYYGVSLDDMPGGASATSARCPDYSNGSLTALSLSLLREVP